MKPDRILAVILDFAVARKIADTDFVVLTNPQLRWQNTACEAL